MNVAVILPWFHTQVLSQHRVNTSVIGSMIGIARYLTVKIGEGAIIEGAYIFLCLMLK